MSVILPLTEAAARFPPRGVLLGLDLGSKTIGVAGSDPDRKVATGIETIARKNFTADAQRLLTLATERAAAGSNPQKADERAHDRLYRNIEAWLCRVGGVYEPSSDQDPDLLKAIVQGGEADYMRAQAEVLAWLVWHKKFCRAYLPAAEDEEI